MSLETYNKGLLAKQNILQAMLSPATQQVAMLEMERLQKLIPYKIAQTCKPNYSNGWEGVYYSVTIYDADYETIMNDPDTIIANTKTIVCNKRKTLYLQSWKGIPLYIEVSFQCALPADDLFTLEMLGKVKRESSTYNSESISCTL